MRDISPDYGLDIEIIIVDGERVTNKVFVVQIKATDLIDISGSISTRIQTKHLKYYQNYPLPVIILYYIRSKNIFYYVNIQQYINEILELDNPNWRKQKYNTIKFPSQSILNQNIDKLESEISSGFQEIFKRNDSQEISLDEISSLTKNLIEQKSFIKVASIEDTEIAKSTVQKQYFDYFKYMRDQLDLLKSDLNIARDGWNIDFALDFATLFFYLFPFSGTRQYVMRLPQETQTESFFRGQVSLAFTFSKLEQQRLFSNRHLVLLPPYIDEMRITLRNIQERLIRTHTMIDILSTIEKQAFGDPFRDIETIINKIDRGSKLTDIDRLAIASYIEKEYTDLVSILVTGSDNTGVKYLNKMISSNLLLSVQDYYEEVLTKDDINPKDLLNNIIIERNKEKWLTKFGVLRPERSFQNFIDAKACASIETINWELKDNKRILLLISHANSMNIAADQMKSLENRGIVNGTSRDPTNLSVVRNLDYLWFYYVHQGVTLAETSNNVMFTLDMLNEYLYQASRLEMGSQITKHISNEVHDLLGRINNLSVSMSTAQALTDWLWLNDTGFAHSRNELLGHSMLNILSDKKLTRLSLEILSRQRDTLKLTLEIFNSF